MRDRPDLWTRISLTVALGRKVTHFEPLKYPVVIQLMLGVCDDLGIAMSPSSARSYLEAYRLGQEQLKNLRWGYN